MCHCKLSKYFDHVPLVEFVCSPTAVCEDADATALSSVSLHSMSNQKYSIEFNGTYS